MSESGIIQNLFFPARRKNAASSPAKETATAMLVERLCMRDENAFNEFYKKLAPMVHGIVLARVPRDEVDDIVQEVFVSAFQNINSLRDKDAVGGWVANIARNRTAEYYRRSKPTEELSENLSKNQDSIAKAHEVLAAIKSLPEAYNETLILRLVEGMTGPEIAEQTGLTADSVRVNLHRGMKLLREKLEIEV